MVEKSRIEQGLYKSSAKGVKALSKNGYLIGLDIGSSSVKFVELRKGKERPVLRQLGLAHLFPETIVEGAIIDRHDLINTIKRLSSKFHIKNRKVAISVSGTPVIVKRVTLSYMTEEELDETIGWEAEKYLSFDISEANIDYHIISSDEENNRLEVLIAAAKKEMIEEYLSIVTEAGLNVKVVDIDSFAVGNAYTFSHESIENETLILVDIGASLMNLNIVSSGETIFTRDVAIGGHNFTEDIQKQTGNTFEEAERLKRGLKRDSDQKTIVDNVIDAAMTSVSDEISKSINFYNTTFGRNEVSKIVISGGTALMEGLTQHIQESIGISTDIMNPFEGADINERTVDWDLIESSSPMFAVAFGLSLRKEKEDI